MLKIKDDVVTCEGCGANTEYFAIVDNKKLCAKCEQRTKSKNQRIIELCNQIDKLEQQLAEKDKEIERLKNLFELNNEVVINQGKEIFDLRVQVLQQKQNQTQLAIQKLEEVKVNLKDRISMMKNEEHSYLQKVVAWYDICDQINQQIKELKGEITND